MLDTEEIFSQPPSILYLLPYSEHTVLSDKSQKLSDLYFIKSVFGYSMIALERFMLGDLSLFDAQVGENLCQVRAYKILQLSKKYHNSTSSRQSLIDRHTALKAYNSHLEQVITDWKKAIQVSHHYHKSLDKKEGMHAFLKRHDLFCVLNEDIIFIVACYFLAHFNIHREDILGTINLAMIADELNISKYKANRLKHKYQSLVCKLGCNFILTIAPDLKERVDYGILPQLYKIADENRAVLPCLMVTEVILYHCLQESIPIFLIIRRKVAENLQDVIYAVLGADTNRDTLFPVLASQYLEQPCLVISGHVKLPNFEMPSIYWKRLVKMPLLTVILANTASHPQYSGEKLIPFKENPFANLTTYPLQHAENLINLRQIALQEGCSQENQSMFFLRHIYASQVATEIKKILDNRDIASHDGHNLMNV